MVTKIIAYSFAQMLPEGWQHADYVELNSFLSAAGREQLLTQIQEAEVALSVDASTIAKAEQVVADYQVDLVYDSAVSTIRRLGHWSDTLSLASFEETALHDLPKDQRDPSIPLARLVAQQTAAINKGTHFLRTASPKTANRVRHMMAQLDSAHRLAN